MQEAMIDFGRVFKAERLAKKETDAKLKAASEQLEHDNAVLTQTYNDLRAETRTLQSEITILKTTGESLSQQKQLVGEELSNLKDTQAKLMQEQTALESQIQGKKADLSGLSEEFTTKQAEFEQELSILEAKKQKISQEIIDNKAKDEVVRENLSNWSKTLDEKDKNLRIREAKVAEKEKAIVRNYNLLNL